MPLIIGRPKGRSGSLTLLRTPQKNRIIGAVKILDDLAIPSTKQRLATNFDTTANQVDSALKSTSERINFSSIKKKDNAKKVTEKDLDAVERFPDPTGFKSAKLN
jgi:hypothetical protein